MDHQLARKQLLLHIYRHVRWARSEPQSQSIALPIYEVLQSTICYADEVRRKGVERTGMEEMF